MEYIETTIDLLLKLFSILTWPVVIIVILLIFRKNLQNLIDRITYLKVPGWEMEIAKQLEKSDHSFSKQVKDLDEQKRVKKELRLKYEKNPQKAIKESRKTLLKEIDKNLQKKGVKPPQDPIEKIAILSDKFKIPAEQSIAYSNFIREADRLANIPINGQYSVYIAEPFLSTASSASVALATMTSSKQQKTDINTDKEDD